VVDTVEKVSAVIEDAGIKDVFDVFARKPPGLKFNETDVITVMARTEDGSKVSRCFYFCLKPDGTFNERTIGSDITQGRRHRLAAFLRYYGMAKNVKHYNLRDKIGEWIGKSVEVVPMGKDSFIYVP
jgi:hypothetical protein